MIWLLAAEARKLVRPLAWGSALAAAVFLVLLTWAATSNARSDLASPRVPDVCAGAPTQACRVVINRARADALTAARATRQLEQPGAVGQVAAGMLASLPGLLLVALISGGHWGGEWGSRTIRVLLTREGRRTKVLLAKWLTVWAAGVWTMIACWAVLAAPRAGDRRLVRPAACGWLALAGPRPGGLVRWPCCRRPRAVQRDRDRRRHGSPRPARHDGRGRRLHAGGARHRQRRWPRRLVPGIVRAVLDGLRIDVILADQFLEPLRLWWRRS